MTQIAAATRRRLLLGLGGAALFVPRRGRAQAGDRIVSIGAAVTEILYAIGLGPEIVALDTTSQYPPEALREKPNVGYLRQLSPEGILSVKPTLVLAVDGAGPPDVLQLVRDAGVRVVPIADVPTEAGALDRIAAVAAATGRTEAGARLADAVRARFAELAAIRAGIRQPVSALFVLSTQNGRTMVGGRGTTADGMLALAGARNAADVVEGYRPMSDEGIIASHPDVVVMMAQGPGGAPPADLFERPAFAQTPAAAGRRLIVMDGSYLLGFGPRSPAAARELMLALYPGLRPG